MANWKETVELNPILSKWEDLDQSDDLPAELRAEVVALLKTSKRIPQTFTEELEDPDTSSLLTVEDFNCWLEDLYNYCDKNLIWLGI